MWARIGDTTYLYGTADAGVDVIIVRPYTGGPQPADPTPISTEVLVEAGWPNGVYIVALRPDWCSVEVDGGGPNGITAPAGPIPLPPDCQP